MNWWPWSEKYRWISSSELLMIPTVVMAYSPRWDRTSRGWGSVSLIQPMPLHPWKSVRSFSNFVRNGVFSMEWICRWNPSFSSWMSIPPRRVPRWEW